MPTLYGNTSGLSPHAVQTLERIYRRRIPLAELASPELVRSLAAAAHEAGRQVGALVHRSGEVDYVVVGDATRLMLPDIGRLRAAQGRFRGLRLVHTHLFGEELSRDDLVDLVRLRLDAVAAVQLTPEGEPRSIQYAYNTPVRGADLDALGADGSERAKTRGDAKGPIRPYRTVGPVLFGRLDLDFGALIAALEDEFARHGRLLRVAQRERAILLHVAEKSAPGGVQRAETSLRELTELARTAGIEVVAEVVQVRDRLDPRYVMGRGKVDEVLLLAAERDAQLLVFDRNLSPSQASALAKHTDLKVIDRTQLILDIFAQRAESADGKLQVELAQLKYALPRLAQKDDSLSRLTGGIGGRGPGETKLEVGRRRAKDRVAHLEAELKKLGRQREQRRSRRVRLAVPVVAIVGYTNAGKSTLLNALTDADVLAEDKLFATLDTRSRRLRFPEEREVVLTDTVGFIRDLPADLFAAFRATFEEAADADLILHVVDASDPAMDDHIETTERLLDELDLANVPRLVVFNKVDRVGPGLRTALLRYPLDRVLVSATDRASLAPLLTAIAERLADRWRAARPWDEAPAEPTPAPAEATPAPREVWEIPERTPEPADAWDPSASNVA